METPQFDFLRSYIERLIDESGAFNSLSEQTRNEYIPQFVAEAERRIGLSVLPYLKEESAKEFKNMVEGGKTEPEHFYQFWREHVPNLDDVVKKTLQDFAAEFKQAIEGV